MYSFHVMVSSLHCGHNHRPLSLLVGYSFTRSGFASSTIINIGCMSGFNIHATFMPQHLLCFVVLQLLGGFSQGNIFLGKRWVSSSCSGRLKAVSKRFYTFSGFLVPFRIQVHFQRARWYHISLHRCLLRNDQVIRRSSNFMM